MSESAKCLDCGEMARYHQLAAVRGKCKSGDQYGRYKENPTIPDDPEPTDHTERGEVLSREEYENVTEAFVPETHEDWRGIFLTHDAAQREEIERLRGAIREICESASNNAQVIRHDRGGVVMGTGLVLRLREIARQALNETREDG